mgnify:CR=1 FL=1
MELLDEYEMIDFVRAIQECRNLEDLIDYDGAVEIAAHLLEDVPLEDMQQFKFHEAMIAVFANGIIVGLIAAEKRKDRLKPLIEH